jgi:hypothetical protein
MTNLEPVSSERFVEARRRRLAETRPLTTGEKGELKAVVKGRAKLAQRDIDVVVAARTADFEEQLATQYDCSDERWKAIVTAGRERMRAVVAEETAKINAEIIAQLPDVAAIYRPAFGAGALSSWSDRGENADPGRRGELRRVFKSRINAQAIEAHVTIDRRAQELTEQLILTTITAGEGAEWLDQLPTPEALIPGTPLAAIEAEVIEGHRNDEDEDDDDDDDDDDGYPTYRRRR